MKKLLLFILSLYIGISTSFGQLPTTCANMDPICSNSGLNFTAENSGYSASSGNNSDFDCLSTQPNPTWYYLEVATSGPINMTLSAGSDVDYILYGPYSSLANAQSYCGNMGTAGSGSSTNSVVNCSYNPSATETPNIPNAIAGQVYVLLITNYANVVQTITLDQSNLNDAGAGLTDCSIVTPCSISNLNVTVGACNPGTNTFNVTGTIGVTNPPPTGTLIAVDCNGHQTTVATAPFSASSYNFAINNIPSDGATCNVQVYFSADPTCTQTLSYTNPPPCNPTCSITNFSVIDTAECNQMWKTDVTVEFISPPATGNLVVKDCQGNITVIQSAPFSSPVSATFSTTVGSATPFNCDYTAYFTADPTCESIVSFAPLPATPPSDEAGTFTENMIGDGTNTYILCDGDEFDMSSNGDSNIPPIAPGNDPSVIYFVYSCPPSPGGPGIDPTNDPCFEGFISQAAITLINNGGSADPFLTSLGTLTNNTFYLVPMTLGSLSGLTYQQNCYDLATEATQIVQYLNPITYTVTSDCQAGTVTVSNLQGGYPEFYGGNYTASNLVPGTASFGTASAPLGGSIFVTGLNDGDAYSFDITDGNGCPITITGTFVGVQDPSFTYPNNAYCNTDSDPSPTITGVTGGTFTVSPSGVTVNSSTGVIDLSSSTTGGTYTITYTTPAATCFGTQTFVVTIYPQPTVSAGVDQNICDGTSVVLAGSGASTYTWDNSVTNNVSFTQALGPITYTVTGTDSYGCMNTDQVIVTVNPNPTPAITGADEYCVGFYTTLNAGSGYSTYTWSTGANTQTINATTADNPITVTVTTSQSCSATTGPFTVIENTTITTSASYQICQGASMMIHGISETTSGVYSQTYPSSLGCDSTSNITLTVNPLPNVNAGLDQSICPGTSTSLTATGATSFTWDNSITQGATFTPAVGTITYTVTGTDANSCVNTDAVDIVVNPLPNVNAGIDQSVCFGGSVTLSGSNAQTYTWNNSVVDNVSFSPITTQTYTVTGTDAFGCINTDQVLVTVNPLPIVNAGTDQTVCNGIQVTLTGTGATSYTWNNGITNGVAFTQSIGTINYTVTGTDAFGCINTDNVDVTVNALPTINAGTDQTVCNGTQVTLNGAGAGTGGTYTWDNGVPNGVPFTQTVGITTYIVTGTDANGCTNTDVVDITVNAIPVVNAGPDQSVCIGSQVTLTASGSTTYVWDNGISDGVAFTPALGSVTYTVSGTTSGCTSTDQVIVTVNPLPTINAGSDVSACENQTVILTAFGAGVGGTYTWDKGAVNAISFLPTATTYTVTGTNVFGCVNKDSLVVNIIPTPVVDFFGDKLLGCSPLSVSFTNNSSGNLTNCQWSLSNGINLTGCGSFSSTFTAVGCYDVTLTVNTPEGCTNTATLTDYVCVLPNPVADFYTDPKELSTIDWEATMVNTSVGATLYNWSFGDGSTATNEFEPKHPYPNEQSGTYLITLTVKNAGGCTDSTTRTITLTEDLIFYVPNTFTPDNDDFNEVFKPVFTSGFDPFNYTMYIFDRWGEVLFESHNTDVGWDGTYGGKLVGDGTYIWKISVKRRDSDKYIERIGHVNILR